MAARGAPPVGSDCGDGSASGRSSESRAAASPVGRRGLDRRGRERRPWKHRDRHFACAAIAYNVWLASRGPDGILTMRSLESGYGAAKVLLFVHALLIAWAMIPAEHWPL